MTRPGRKQRWMLLGRRLLLAPCLALLPLSAAADVDLRLEVLDSRAEPSSTAEVWLGLLTTDDASWQRVESSPAGGRRVHLPQDPRIRALVLMAATEEDCGFVTKVVQRRTLLQGELTLTAALARPAALQGRLVSAAGRPIGAAEVFARLAGADYSERHALTALTGEEAGLPQALRAWLAPEPSATGADGQFDLTGLCAGAWRIYAQPRAALGPPEVRLVLPLPTPPVPARTGEPPPPDLTLSAPAGSLLSGQVLEVAREGGEPRPVDQARVGLTLDFREGSDFRRERLQTTSNADGRFAFEGLPIATGTLWAESDRHPRVERVLALPTPEFARLELQRSSALRFTIDLAEPPALVEAEVLREFDGRWRPLSAPPLAIEPESDGVFSLGELPPGELALRVRVAGYLPLHVEPFLAPAGGIADLGALSLERGRRLRGRVVESGTLRPIAGAEVSLKTPRLRSNRRGALTSGPPPTPTDSTDELGRFELTGLSDRRLTVLVKARGYSVPVGTDTTVALDGAWQDDSDELLIELERTGDLGVRVLSRDGVAVLGERLRLKSADGSWKGELVTSPPDGVARFSGLAPGPALVFKGSTGSRDSDGAPVEIESGAEAELVIRETGCRVQGRVLFQGRPVPSRVSLGHARWGSRPQAMTLEPYELRDVPAGKQAVTLEFPDLSPDGGWSSSGYSRRSAEMEVPEGAASLAWDFEVVPGEAGSPEPPATPTPVEGQLVDVGTGEPVQLAIWAWRRSFELEAPTDVQGRFSLMLPENGDWKLMPKISDDHAWYFTPEEGSVTVTVEDGRIVSSPSPLVVPVFRPWLVSLQLLAQGQPIVGAECRPLEGFYLNGDLLRPGAAAPMTSDGLGRLNIQFESERGGDAFCIATGLGAVFLPTLTPSRDSSREPVSVAFGLGAELEVNHGSCSSPPFLRESVTGSRWRLHPAASRWLADLVEIDAASIRVSGLPAGDWLIEAPGCESELASLTPGARSLLVLKPSTPLVHRP